MEPSKKKVILVALGILALLVIVAFAFGGVSRQAILAQRVANSATVYSQSFGITDADSLVVTSVYNDTTEVYVSVVLFPYAGASVTTTTAVDTIDVNAAGIEVHRTIGISTLKGYERAQIKFVGNSSGNGVSGNELIRSFVNIYKR